MFDLDQVIINKETKEKFTVEFVGVGGGASCIKSKLDGKRYSVNGHYLEKHFREVKIGD